MTTRRKFIVQCLGGVAFTSAALAAPHQYHCYGKMSPLKVRVSGGYTVTFTLGVSPMPGLDAPPPVSFVSSGAELNIPETGVGYSSQRRGGLFEFVLKGVKAGRQDLRTVKTVDVGSTELTLKDGDQFICGFRANVTRTGEGLSGGGWTRIEKITITLSQIT